MAFVFRFQQILAICLHEENEVKIRLAQKDGQMAAIKAEVDKLKDEYAKALEHKANDLQAGEMMRVQMYPAYLTRLQRAWEFQEEELERLEKQRQKIFDELMIKRRSRMTYEKMREKDEAVYKKEMLKKEQKRLDEYGNRLKKTAGDDNDA
ncbi:MAG: flagellar export protein FliJ [Candidatus Riflebacteria bacterium HGW-Riflebacteria-2]|jgi:flagellar FliJ protein|nr:MAG: flagellar export protein FliJ [Candidatus Riflebacteria bacterium HGW-Riflebacteria-2]